MESSKVILILINKGRTSSKNIWSPGRF